MDSSTEKKVLPLRAAAEAFGSNDLDGFREQARKFKAYIKLGGGLEFVDVPVFEAAVQASLDEKLEQASKPRAPKKTTTGSRLGIVSARLASVEKRVKKNEADLAAVKVELENAESPYAKNRATKKIADLEAARERIETNRIKDEALRDQILNEDTAG